MAIVIEITNRSGRVLDHHIVAKPSATIGRSYTNDVVLHDPYVDGAHLQIDNSLTSGLTLTVCSSNGHTLINKEPTQQGTYAIASGVTVTIGKTHLRVMLSTHDVAPMLNFERVDRAFSTLAQPGVAIALTLAYLLFAAGDQYMSTVSEIQWSRWAMQIVSPLLAAVVWTGVWALVTRVTRGDSRFFYHWVVVLLVLSMFIAWDYVMEVVRFNVGMHVLVDVLDYASTGIVLAVLFWLHLRFAFSQSAALRHLTAQSLAWAVVGYTVLTSYSFTSDFRSVPEFASTLLPPALLFVQPASEDEFLEDVDELFTFSPEELAVDK